jgi:hypothetical protein
VSHLNEAPPVVEGNPAPIYALVPPAHRDLVRAVWEQDRVPLASMKMENDLSAAVGITFTMAGFRYDRRRRREAVRAVCTRAGNPGAADTVLAASAHVERVLGLLCLPVEVMGFDVGPREIRQVKAYIRTNICNERFEDKVIACDGTSRELELEAVSGVLDIVAPHRRESVLGILSRLQSTKGALEGIAVDLHGDEADVKLYFLPRRTGDEGETYTDAQVIEFIDTSLDMFGLERHRGRAHAMVRDMRGVGLACSFLAVEEKPDGGNELKVDFNTARTGDTFPGRRVPPAVAAAAIRAAFAAAGTVPDETALANLVGLVGEDGILLDDFTTDFGAVASSGKVYLRSASDLGCGVFARS